MKKIFLIIFLILTSSNLVFAEYGDVYFCNTVQISELKEDKVKSNFETIKFKMQMQGTDTESGIIVFSEEALGSIVNNLGFADFLFVETHVKPEQFMAGLGSTSVWFHEGELSITSIFTDDSSNLIRIVSSLSKCDKF